MRISRVGARRRCALCPQGLFTLCFYSELIRVELVTLNEIKPVLLCQNPRVRGHESPALASELHKR
jgi:hypothetical protein